MKHSDFTEVYLAFFSERVVSFSQHGIGSSSGWGHGGQVLGFSNTLCFRKSWSNDWSFLLKIIIGIEFLLLSPLSEVHFLDLFGVLVLDTGLEGCLLDFHSHIHVKVDECLPLTIIHWDILSFFWLFGFLCDDFILLLAPCQNVIFNLLVTN